MILPTASLGQKRSLVLGRPLGSKEPRWRGHVNRGDYRRGHQHQEQCEHSGGAWHSGQAVLQPCLAQGGDWKTNAGSDEEEGAGRSEPLESPQKLDARGDPQKCGDSDPTQQFKNKARNAHPRLTSRLRHVPPAEKGAAKKKDSTECGRKVRWCA